MYFFYWIKFWCEVCFFFFPTVAFICLMACWKQLWATPGLKIWMGRTRCELSVVSKPAVEVMRTKRINISRSSLCSWDSDKRKKKKKLQSFYQKVSCLSCTPDDEAGELGDIFLPMFCFCLVLFVVAVGLFFISKAYITISMAVRKESNHFILLKTDEVHTLSAVQACLPFFSLY